MPSVPTTYHVDVDRAVATLRHAEMIALAVMYERWALTETGISGEQRTKLIEWSADYECIASYVGATWHPTDPEHPPGLVAFLARRELAHHDASWEGGAEVKGS